MRTVRHPGERDLPRGDALHELRRGRGHATPAGGIDQIAEHVGSMHPLGRPITAEDCAEAAVYLVSDRARNITGVLLPVDGGYVAR